MQTSNLSALPIKRKIFQYRIMCQRKSKTEPCEFSHISLLMNEIKTHIKQTFYLDSLTDKWYGFDSINAIATGWQLILANCKYNYRPNLIDINNRLERQSPKNSSEGDKEKTHVIIKADATIIFEQRRNGTGAYIFNKLLNAAWKRIKNTIDNDITSIKIEQEIDNNFLEIIREANRIKGLKVVAESHIVGSEYLNFCNDTGVKDTYEISIRAKKRHEFNKETFIQKIEQLLAENTQVDKIIVDLNDNENNPRIINTDQFAKQYVIYVNKDSHGEVDTIDMFSKMNGLL